MGLPLLLVVDGNSLLHRAHHAWADSNERDERGMPVWGLLGLTVAVAAAVARCRPDALLVGFDCAVRSQRREAFAGYKAHRPDKSEDLRHQLDTAPALFASAGIPTCQIEGQEADDVLASGAALARRQGWRAVLVTSDRDAFCLIDQTTSVLRVVSGGMEESPMLAPEQVSDLYGVAPHAYRDLAVLRGDPSDNLPGVPGVGNRLAARLLTRFGSLGALFAALEDDDQTQAVRAVAGDRAVDFLRSPAGRTLLERNRVLMTQREDLPLPGIDLLRLPLDGPRLRGTLRGHGIRLSRSLWALIGEQPPPWTPNGFDKAPAALPRVEAPPWALSRWYESIDLRSADIDSTATASTGASAPRRAAVTRNGARRPAPVPVGQQTLF